MLPSLIVNSSPSRTAAPPPVGACSASGPVWYRWFGIEGNVTTTVPTGVMLITPPGAVTAFKFSPGTLFRRAAMRVANWACVSAGLKPIKMEPTRAAPFPPGIVTVSSNSKM